MTRIYDVTVSFLKEDDYYLETCMHIYEILIFDKSDHIKMQYTCMMHVKNDMFKCIKTNVWKVVHMLTTFFPNKVQLQLK